MKRIYLFLIIVLSCYLQTNAQSFLKPHDKLVNGYASKVSGLDFDYHSCIPGFRDCMLLRATNGKDFMEWTTEPAPVVSNGDEAAFVWIAALGSSPGKARMDLEVDGSRKYIFYTDAVRNWEVPGSDGSSLSFNTVMTDQNGDNHGYMILRLPASQVVPGKALKIRVTGGRADLTSWYIMYRKPVKTGVTLNPFPAILKKGNGGMQLVEAGIFYFGKNADAKIFIDGKLNESTALQFGYNVVNLGITPVAKQKDITVKVVAGEFSVSKKITLMPVKKWTISFIQHTHTDIGYTRSQTDILAEHLRYIDYALDYCDATDSYPEDSKFRWTCEASWPVDEYIKCRPAAQVERLLRRIHEGRIEVTGMYFNFDELPDENILASSLAAAGRLKERGIPVSLAMQDDVNGIGWCMSDYFKTMGIRYLNMGTHGHRALICFDKPTMFWWESPAGNRILTFRAEHYMTGNTVFEMQSGNIERFRNKLLNYLISLEAKNYPWDRMAIQHSGYQTDNSPPSTISSDLIKQWNEQFLWPHLETSVAESFFTTMEKEHGSEFPVIRGAWPDWWTDGFGASARESATTRVASSTLTANEAGLTMAALSGTKLPVDIGKSIDLTNNALLFYTEHTTGYSESVREPLSQPTMEQRALKESYAWEANRRTASLGEEALGLLQNNFSREKDPVIVVFNTLNWKRSGVGMVWIDHQLVPSGREAVITDADGNKLAVQPVQTRSDVTQWAVYFRDIPAFGYKKYTLRAGEDTAVSSKNDEEQNILENKWYKVVVNRSKGTVSSLYDKELGTELIDNNSQYQLGEFIHEQLGNRSQMESRRLVDYKRSPLDTVWFDSYRPGEIWNSIRFYGESPTFVGPKGFSIEIRLFNTEKRIDVACSVIKKNIVDPESFYIAFPFALQNGKHFTEVQGGIIETGKDQIKGSSNDWYTVQDFTLVRNEKAQIVLSSPEMPLMQFGAINTGRYTAGAMPQGTNMFSWPMNNYWVTNFNADQRGGHSWTYNITTTADNTDDFATGFGWGNRIPFLTRVIPGSGTGNNRSSGTFITGWPESVLLVSATPSADGKSAILHLRETGGKKHDIELINTTTGKKFEITRTDVNGRVVEGGSVSIAPLESAFYKITID